MEALTILRSCDNCCDKDSYTSHPMCKGEGCKSGCWVADTSVHKAISKFFDAHPDAEGFVLTPIKRSEGTGEVKLHGKRPEQIIVDEVAVPSGSEVGVKFDNGKPRFDLIPPEALFGLAELYRIGAEKYADRNWENGMSFSRLFGAMQRHAWAFMSGEDYATDDGQHHLLSVAWCALSLYTYWCRGLDKEFDDRPHKTLAAFPPVFPEIAVATAMEVR